MIRRVMRRRTLARCAVVLLASVSVAACAGIKLPRLPGAKGASGSKYQGPGTRIPVLPQNQQLQPAAALKGVDFALPPPQPVAEWPLPGGNPEQAVDNVAAAPAFQVAWRKRIGQGRARGHYVTATPIVAGGRIYTLDAGGLVSARDAKTGNEIWRREFAPRGGRDREGYGGGLAEAGGVVYFASGYRFITAMDAATGAVKWRTAMSSPIHGAPTVVGDRLFVVDVVNQLFAVNTADGAIAWNYQALEEPARMIAASSPAVSGDVVVAPFASGELIAFRAANGTPLWQDTLSFTNRNNALSEIRDIPGRPAIYRDDVFAGSHSGLFAATTLREGQRRWELPIATITTPLPSGDVVYVTDQSGKVICIARDSGQVFWATDLNAGVRKAKQRGIWSGPLLAGERLIVISNHGDAAALNPKTGARMATLKLGSGSVLSPIAAGGMVYVISDAGDLIAIR